VNPEYELATAVRKLYMGYIAGNSFGGYLLSTAVYQPALNHSAFPVATAAFGTLRVLIHLSKVGSMGQSLTAQYGLAPCRE